MIDTSHIIGRVKAISAIYAPKDMDFETRQELKAQIRKESKYYKITDDACCFVCSGKDKLQKHHLMAVHKFPHREDSNDHLIPLCEEHHGIWHKIDDDRLDRKTREDMKEAGYWVKFVELDRLSAKALIGIEGERAKGISEQMRLAL